MFADADRHLLEGCERVELGVELEVNVGGHAGQADRPGLGPDQGVVTSAWTPAVLVPSRIALFGSTSTCTRTRWWPGRS
jgi:hypothetical protein